MTPPNWIIRGWRNHAWWLLLLAPFAWLYSFLATINTRSMRSRAIKVQPQVIVIGNISLGGTGKTSFVLWLAQQLAQGATADEVAIVSKGYGRTQSYSSPVRVPSDAVAQGQARLYGDEPAMLAAMLPKIAVWVCDSRCKAITHTKARWVICDDGLQDYTFYPRYECALIDGTVGFANQHIFPRGILREKVTRLDSCNLVLQQGGGELTPPATGRFVVQISGFSNLMSGEHLNIQQAQHQWLGQQLHLCCGLANNQRVFDQMDNTGIITHKHPFPDHHPFSRRDIQHPGIVLLTAKDASKCTAFVNSDCWQIDTTLVIDTNLKQHILDSLQHTTSKQTG